MNGEDFSRLHLIELKASRLELGQDLKGQFWSFQYPEQLAAQAFGVYYEFVFVVNPKNPVIRKFRWNELWALARSVHIQFSVSF